MLPWPQERLPQRRHFLSESGEGKLHSVLRDTDPHCSRRLQLGKAAPSPQNYLAAAAQAFDNNGRVAYCILSTHPFVDSGAVRQSIHELEDAYRDAQDRADLPRRGVLLFLIWRGSSAAR